MMRVWPETRVRFMEHRLFFEGISLEERVHKWRVEYSKIYPLDAVCWVRVPAETRREADLTAPKALKGKLLSIKFRELDTQPLDGNREKTVISRDVVFKLAREESSSPAVEAVMQAVPLTRFTPHAAEHDTQVAPEDSNAAPGGDKQGDAEELTGPQDVQGDAEALTVPHCNFHRSRGICNI